MQSGRVLYRKNMRVTAKQSWYNRTEQYKSKKANLKQDEKLEMEADSHLSGGSYPFSLRTQ